VIDREEADSRYAHTTHLHVRVAGKVVVDRHLSGPVVADIFSVIKSVLATVLGLAAIRGRLPWLDRPVADVLPVLAGTPSSSGSSTGPPTTQRHDPTGAGTLGPSAPALTSTNRHSTVRAGTSTTGLIIRRSWVRAPPAPRKTAGQGPFANTGERLSCRLLPAHAVGLLAAVRSDRSDEAARRGSRRRPAPRYGLDSDGFCVRRSERRIGL